MTRRFVDFDLTQLPAPDAIEVIEAEAILASRMQDVKQRWPEYDVGELETDPIKIDQEVSTYREILMRARVNDAVRATFAAYAKSADLDNVAANLGVSRLAGESDERLRTRYFLALEAFSTAGPYGAYYYYSMTASVDLKDVAVYGPESELVTPGQVGIYVLSANGSGHADSGLIGLVLATCSADDVRPLTDEVLVETAEILEYSAQATLKVVRGFDPDQIRSAAANRLTALVTRRHRIGAKVPLSALIAAAHVEGVLEVDFASPIEDIVATSVQAPYCTAIELNYEIVDDA